MWSLKWYYLGIRSSGKALTSGVMLFTFNKRCSSDSKLWECVMEEVSSLPLAGRIVSTGISTHLQQLTEVANEFGVCFSPIWWTVSVPLVLKAPGDPTSPSNGSSKALQIAFNFYLFFFRASYHCSTHPAICLHQAAARPQPFGATGIIKCKWRLSEQWGKHGLMGETCLGVPGQLCSCSLTAPLWIGTEIPER